MQTNSDNLGLVWGAKGIASVINGSERQVYHMLLRKDADGNPAPIINAAKRISGRWCADLAGLRAQFCSQGEKAA